MEKLINEALERVTTPTQCLLCEAKLSNPHNAESHYGSKMHKKNVNVFREEVRKNITMQKKPQLQPNLATTVKPVNLSCNICDLTFSSQDIANVHYQSEVHKNTEDLYCKICCIRTISKSDIWNHYKSAKHQQKYKVLNRPPLDDLYSPFCNDLPKELRDCMLFDTCHVCNVSFLRVQLALHHYRSAKHQLACRHWFKEKRQPQKKPALTIPTTIIQPVIQPAPKTIQPQLWDAERCYLCRVTLTSRLEYNDHKQEFPHADLITFKCDLIKQGILEEFWTIRAGLPYCTLCSVKVASISVLNSHFNSAAHCRNYDAWLQDMLLGYMPAKKILLETDTKWYYCKICNTPLDGTSCAVLHYSGNMHLKNMKLYCQLCDFRTNLPELLKEHNSSMLHVGKLQEKQQKEATSGTARKKPAILQDEVCSTTKPPNAQTSKPAENIKMSPKQSQDSTTKPPNVQTSKPEENIKMSPKQSQDSTTKPPNVQTSKPEENIKMSPKQSQDSTTKSLDPKPLETQSALDETQNLKGKVFNELEKLVKKLYYSKAVPYEASLEFLKKINKEVEDLAKKYDDKTKTDVIAIPQKNLITPNQTEVGEFRDNHDNNLEKGVISPLEPNSELNGATSSNYYVTNNKSEFNGDTFYPFQDSSNPEKITKCKTEDEYTSRNWYGFKVLSEIVSDIDESNGKLVSCGVDKEAENAQPLNGPEKVNRTPFLADSANLISPKSSVKEITPTKANIVDTVEGTGFEVPKDIGSLLNDIVYRKAEIEREFPDEQVVEKEVLSEIEILLRQIETGVIPLEETLKCLIGFNAQLETEDVSYGFDDVRDKQPDGHLTQAEVPLKSLMDLEAQLDTEDLSNGCGDVRCEQPVAVQQKQKYTYSQEVLLTMRTVDTFTSVTPKLSDKLNKTKLWYDHEKEGKTKGKKHNTAAAQDCQPTIYDYYAGNNFGHFMDFLDIYLQGSLEQLEEHVAVQQKEKYTYSQEALLTMRTVDTFTSVTPKLSDKLNETKLWYDHEKDGKNKGKTKKLEAAQDCQTTIYDYYSGNNFVHFMDFLDVYLQGSIIKPSEEHDE